jgi:hypothetical protein
MRQNNAVENKGHCRNILFDFRAMVHPTFRNYRRSYGYTIATYIELMHAVQHNTNQKFTALPGRGPSPCLSEGPTSKHLHVQ